MAIASLELSRSLISFAKKLDSRPVIELTQESSENLGPQTCVAVLGSRGPTTLLFAFPVHQNDAEFFVSDRFDELRPNPNGFHHQSRVVCLEFDSNNLLRTDLHQTFRPEYPTDKEIAYLINQDEYKNLADLSYNVVGLKFPSMSYPIAG